MAPRVSPLAAPPPVALPKVSFRKVENVKPIQHAGVHDAQARSFGFNDMEDFHLPDHYIRYIEPIESELAAQVEYDMDEQDREWLDAINAERRKEQLDQVPYETFEIIMDRLEKEWFELMKRVPKHDSALPSEDSTCAICDDGEGENSNAIVFCDGCNLAVHQDCYGVPYIPEGQWLCRKCTVAPETAVSCIFCPNEAGAFKQTTEAKWAHLLCALFIPELTLGNQVFMEHIEGVDRIPKSRWKLSCSLCQYKLGACIQCDKSSCFTAFHVTCARKHGLLTPMKAIPDAEGNIPAVLSPLRALCEKHLTDDMRIAREARLASGEDDAMQTNPSQKSSKSARAYAKTYRIGPPLVPAIVTSRLTEYISRISLRKKQIFILSVCKYWSLKREARRGAPLLKRLHLEPWTASSINKQQSDEAKQHRLAYLHGLRGDLEKVRMLADFARKREREKCRSANIISNFVDSTMFPYDGQLQIALEQISAMDRNHYFANPVSPDQAPDYHNIIDQPMYWDKIQQKLDQREYLNLQDFKDDIRLVLDNSMKYNTKPDHLYHRVAARIKNNAGPVLENLQTSSVQPVNLPSPVGDLEPGSDVLSLLLSTPAIEDYTSMIIDAGDPIGALFSQLPLRVRPPPVAIVPPKKLRGRPPKALRALRTLLAQQPDDGPQNAVGVGFVPRTRAQRADANQRLRDFAGISPPEDCVLGQNAATSVLEVDEKSPPIGSSPVNGLQTKGSPTADIDLTPEEQTREAQRALRRERDRAKREKLQAKKERDRISRAKAKDKMRERKRLEQEQLPEPSTSIRGQSQDAVLDGILPKPTALQNEAAAPHDTLSVSHEVPAEESTHDHERLAQNASGKQLQSGYQASVSNDSTVEPHAPNAHPLQAPFNTMPQLVEHIDDKQSFQMFNEGWTFTEGSSRRGNQGGSSAGRTARGSGRNTGQEVPGGAAAREEAERIRKERRRERDRERRQRDKQAKATALVLPPVHADLPNIPESTMTPRAKGLDVFGSDSSDLSDLSDMDDERENAESCEPQGDSGDKNSGAPWASSYDAPPVIGEDLPSGTLVWAKIPLFPYWPAVVVEPEDPAIRPELLQEFGQKIQEERRRKTGRKVYIVQFYDTRRTWGVVVQTDMALLAEDKKVDLDMLSGVGILHLHAAMGKFTFASLTLQRKSRFKTKDMKRECRRAYEQAIGDLDVPATGSVLGEADSKL